MQSDPPIIELVLSLSFEPIHGPTILDLADLYRNHFQQDYPTFQHAPLLPPLSLHGPAQARLEMMTGLEVPRLWFVSEDTRDLVQIQSDRVSQNWRRIEPQGVSFEYPGYKVVRQRFFDSLDRTRRWAQLNGLASLALQVAELSYVNAIPMTREGAVARLSDVLSFYRGASEPVPVVGFQTGWLELIPDLNGSVHVGTTFQALPDGQPAVALTLDGRLDVGGLGLDDALARFDVLHDKIHEIFDRVVAPEIAQGAKR